MPAPQPQGAPSGAWAALCLLLLPPAARLEDAVADVDSVAAAARSSRSPHASRLAHSSVDG